MYERDHNIKHRAGIEVEFNSLIESHKPNTLSSNLSKFQMH